MHRQPPTEPHTIHGLLNILEECRVDLYWQEFAPQRQQTTCGDCPVLLSLFVDGGVIFPGHLESSGKVNNRLATGIECFYFETYCLYLNALLFPGITVIIIIVLSIQHIPSTVLFHAIETILPEQYKFRLAGKL